jgi:hypothetical protein
MSIVVSLYGEPIAMKHHEDVILWPDGDWCYRDELEEYTHKSDDYAVLKADTFEWHSFLNSERPLEI